MSFKEAILTADVVHSFLNYCPETGVFRWKIARSKRNKIGAIAGSVRKSGYVSIGIGGTTYFGHRLAWFYVHGTWPQQIDHKDLNPTNNAIENLRIGNQSQNMMNRCPWTRKKHNLPKGVARKGNRFRAYIGINKRYLYLGSFLTPEEASAAYMAAANYYFGEFANF